MISKRDYVKLVHNGLPWPLEKHFLATRFIDLYHLSSDVTRYERIKAIRTSSRSSAKKEAHYHEMAKISAQQTNDLDFDSTKEKKLG